MAENKEQTRRLAKMAGNEHGTNPARIYKCYDCEIELLVPPHLEERVKSGYVKCNNPRCPGMRKGGGRYVRK